MKSKVRWVQAKTTLGKSQFVQEEPQEPATWVLSAEYGAPAVPVVGTKAVPDSLLYGGVILAGLGLAWILTRKS